MNRRALALDAWRACLGLPYIWGGSHPAVGYDCSGLVIEGLQAAGVLPRWNRAGGRFDSSAHDLATVHFQGRPALSTFELNAGCLIFYGTAAHYSHVEIVWAHLPDGTFTLAASGGDHTCTTVARAVELGAYVKMRLARPGWLRALDPFNGEGL